VLVWLHRAARLNRAVRRQLSAVHSFSFSKLLSKMPRSSDLDRVLLLGDAFTSKLAMAPLSKDINLEEFETIVWQPATWWAELSDPSAVTAGRWVSSVGRRLDALTNWIMAGNDLVVVLDRLTPITYAPLQRPRDLGAFDFRKTLPLSPIQFEDVTGERLKFSGPATLSGFFDPWLDRLCYRHIISQEHLSPLFTVSAASDRSRQIVGGILPFKAGKLILVPPDNSDPRSSAREDYLLALARLPNSLRKGSSDLPSWIGNFRTQKALQTHEAIQKLSQHIAEVNAQIASHEEEISKDAWTQELYAGTGEGFKNAVAYALSELGLRVVDGPNSRADLIFTDGTRLATAEAKGLEGCVREQNLRQAERWVTEVNHALVSTEAERRNDVDLHRYHEKLEQIGISKGESDLECKGLMIIGTFRKTPLDERTDPDYPDPLARPLGRSRICSMTGLQLFNVLMSIRSDPALREPFIEAIFETNGPLKSSLTWSQFLTPTPPGT
jgi:hypothetical protein